MGVTGCAYEFSNDKGRVEGCADGPLNTEVSEEARSGGEGLIEWNLKVSSSSNIISNVDLHYKQHSVHQYEDVIPYNYSWLMPTNHR